MAQRRVQLTPETRQALRALVVEAMRDGRIRADRIDSMLPDGDELDPDRAEIDAGVRLALGDLGTLTDDEFLAPDVVVEAGEDDDEQFGDVATDAVNFVGRLLSNDADPFALYARALPSARLTREDETALGMTIEEGKLQVLAAVVSSPAVISNSFPIQGLC